MGYRTSYSFDFWNFNDQSVNITEENYMKIIDEFREFSEEAKEALSEEGYSQTQISEWIDLKIELKAFSLKHPNFVFEISGEGEEYLDYWKLYAYNGKIQYEPAVIADFDINKLK